MSIQNQFELENTRRKIALLEKRHSELTADETEDKRVRELTLRSLKKMINQMKEEIVRFQAKTGSGASA